MAKRDSSNLPPPTAFLSLEEVAQRWRRQQLTTDRLLRKFGVPVYRLANKVHLYALSDIEAVEEAAKHKPPQIVSSSWKPGQQNRTSANTAANTKA